MRLPAFILLDDVLDEIPTADLVKELEARLAGGDGSAKAFGGSRPLTDLLEDIEQAAGTDPGHFAILMMRLRNRLGLAQEVHLPKRAGALGGGHA